MADSAAPSLAQICSLHFATIIGNGRVPPIDFALPISLGDSVVLGMRQLGVLNSTSLETLQQTPLRISRFDASGCAPFTLESLVAMKKYPDLVSVNIAHIDAHQTNKFDLAFLVKDCLDENAARSLRHLNISGHSRIIGIKALSRLPSLDSLSISCRPICQNILAGAARHLSGLTVLDITDTLVSDITWIAQLKKLEVLIMHNVKVRSGCAHSALGALSNLKVLDVSKKVTDVDFTVDGEQDAQIDLAEVVAFTIMMHQETGLPAWPLLQSIDMAGNVIAGSGIDHAIEMVDVIIGGCPSLKSLSVVATPLDGHAYTPKGSSQVSVINCATRHNAIEALTHYWNTERDAFTSHSLHAVYYCLQSSYDDFSDAEVRECARLVCRAMGRHLRNIGVQMAGSACLYHLCKMKRIRRLSVSDVQLCMDRCLDAAEEYRQMVQVQKNVWLTICNDYLLQLPGVDFYRTCKVALESMLTSRDSSVARMTIAIVSIVTPKMRPPEAKELTGDERYVRHLVHLMNENLRQLKSTPGPRAENSLFTLKFTLSALWNLTDESVFTCEVFHDAGGVTICFEILAAFKDHSNIQTKVLGILNNVAEVDTLKQKLLENESWMSQLCDCLLGPFLPSDDTGRNRGVERSYFAAGVLSNIMLCPTWIENPCIVTRDFVNTHLINAITSWPPLTGAMVSYRSFDPFVRILSQTSLSGPLMWCLWGVHHVLSHKEKNSTSIGYNSLLQQSGVPSHCKTLLDCPSTHLYVKELAALIMEIWQTGSSLAHDETYPVEADLAEPAPSAP